MSDILAALPSRRGHFLLESGYHTDVWLTLDELFVDPELAGPLVSRLAEQLRPHAINAVCGPLIGGAFLAQAIATVLGARFYFTEPAASGRDGLFSAEYRLPAALGARARGESVAVVDDVMSAGSSMRASVDALERAGATVVVVGSLAVLGERGIQHFAANSVPVETLERGRLDMWAPSECPQCGKGTPLEDPT